MEFAFGIVALYCLSELLFPVKKADRGELMFETKKEKWIYDGDYLNSRRRVSR